MAKLKWLRMYRNYEETKYQTLEMVGGSWKRGSFGRPCWMAEAGQFDRGAGLGNQMVVEQCLPGRDYERGRRHQLRASLAGNARSAGLLALAGQRPNQHIRRWSRQAQRLLSSNHMYRL